MAQTLAYFMAFRIMDAAKRNPAHIANLAS